MSKTTGLLTTFAVGAYDLSGDTSALDMIKGGPALIDVTGLNKSAHERIGGLRDGDLQFTSFFNPGPLAEHIALSPLPTADTIGTVILGSLLGNPAASINAKQVSYDPNRDPSGNLTEKVDLQANGYGVEWGVALTAGLRTDTVATAGSAVDNGAATTFGAQAYLHTTALTGTSVDVKIEHSTDNSTWSTLLDFGSIAAVGAQRATVAGTVNRYVRATTGAGTFTSITFALSFMRNPIAVSF